MLKRFIFIFLLLSLAACSSVSTKKNAMTPPDEAAGAYSQGIGDEETIAGQENRMRAPYNQVYYFAFDDTSADQADLPSIRVQARYLAVHPGAKVLLAGHTDERGSREYNIALGERRAKRVAELLTIGGAKPNQIQIVSYGEEKPKSYGHNEEAYRLNRRVELIYEATR